MLNYYYSGSGINNAAFDTEEMLIESVKACEFRLLSCYKSYVQYAEWWLSYSSALNKDITILFDSGAFTAWNKGSEVTLDQLCTIYYDLMMKNFTAHKNIWLINLDKIPGSPGRTADAAEMAECERISDYNYKVLVKEFGNRVLPVYHQGENKKRLDEVVSMSKYICVSPRNDLPENQRVTWSKEVHALLPADTQTHGLAATGIKMMTQVPWYSVDSASWLFAASNGSVSICLNGKLKLVAVSEKSTNRHTEEQHYSTMPRLTQLAIDKRFEKYGLTFEDLSKSYGKRMLVIIHETNYWLKHHHQFNLLKQETMFDL